MEIVRRHYDRLKLPMPDNADRFALYAFRDALKLLHDQLSEAASKLPKPIATCEEMVTLLSAMGNAASEPAALKMAVAALHELIFRMGVVAVGRPSTELDSQNAVALFIRLVIQCESVNDPVADADVEELIDKARRTSSSVGRGRPSAHHHLAWALQSAEGKSAEVIAANHRTLTGKSVQPASVGKCVERFVNRATSAEVRRAVWLQLHATSD
ncbi:MAG: hypothetical protein C0485_15135 [Pirellula sp.]|nr:hypothetical protein [Pirellula sp.]